MSELKNIRIKDLKEIKRAEDGSWILFSIDFEGDNKHYDYFGGGGRYVPQRGDVVSIEYESSRKQSAKTGRWFPKNEIKNMELSPGASSPGPGAAPWHKKPEPAQVVAGPGPAGEDSQEEPYRVLAIRYMGIGKIFASLSEDPVVVHNTIVKLYGLMDNWIQDQLRLANSTAGKVLAMARRDGLNLATFSAWIAEEVDKSGVVFKAREQKTADMGILALPEYLATYILANWKSTLAEFQDKEAEYHTGGGAETPGADDEGPGFEDPDAAPAPGPGPGPKPW